MQAPPPSPKPPRRNAWPPPRGYALLSPLHLPHPPPLPHPSRSLRLHLPPSPHPSYRFQRFSPPFPLYSLDSLRRSLHLSLYLHVAPQMHISGYPFSGSLQPLPPSLPLPSPLLLPFRRRSRRIRIPHGIINCLFAAFPAFAALSAAILAASAASPAAFAALSA